MSPHQILVTDEMIEAGLRELDTSYDKRSDEDVVKAIYTAMHQAMQSAQQAPDDVERGSLTLDNASVQRLMDYGLLHYTDGKWQVALATEKEGPHD